MNRTTRPNELSFPVGSIEELTLIRLTLVFGATLYPAWAVVYRFWLPDAIDPMWQRLAVGAFCLGVLALTWAPNQWLRRQLQHFFALSGWVVTGHIFYLMTLNHMNVSYVLGGFLVVFAVSASLTSRAHMLLYSAFTCVASLVSSTGLVPTPIFVTGVVTVSIIGAGLMAVRINLTRRGQIREAAKAALESELAFGRQVQRLTMPDRLADQIGGYAYRVVVRPHLHLSGDWSQVYLSPSGSEDPVTVIAIGDVVGKGASAALATTVIASVWRTETAHWRLGTVDVPNLIHALNDAIYGVFKGDQNSTLSLIVMRSEEVELHTFGAPPWLIRHADGSIEKPNFRGANPLGFQAQVGVPNPIRMLPAVRDLYIAYTDGVIDSTQARRAFIKEVGEVGDLPPADLLEWIEGKAIARSRTEALADDFTMVAVLLAEQTKSILGPTN